MRFSPSHALPADRRSTGASDDAGQRMRRDDERGLHRSDPHQETCASRRRSQRQRAADAIGAHGEGWSDTRSLNLQNVGMSFVELHGDDHAANRFYLEDMAIGLMRPPLNIDIER